MHEAQQDAEEFDKEHGPFSGLFCLILFFGLVYFISYLSTNHKENKERRETIKINTEKANNISNKELLSNINISKFQYKESWQKGYRKATYDRLYGTPRVLYGKTLNDLIIEYRHLCELGHIIQADKIMEDIGYFQNLDGIKNNHDQNQ